MFDSRVTRSTIKAIMNGLNGINLPLSESIKLSSAGYWLFQECRSVVEKSSGDLFVP